eukprot:6359234-Pyramimonas_sp.AAC.1
MASGDDDGVDGLPVEVKEVRKERGGGNIPTRRASDGSVVGIYPRSPRLIGMLWEYTCASCV